MVTVNNDPDAGGNVDQPEDGRDEKGRLPEPLDAARFPGEALDLPGMPLSQPAGTGAVVSTPVEVAGVPEEGGNVDQPAADVNDAGELAAPPSAQEFPGAGTQPQQDPRMQASVNKPTGVPKQDEESRSKSAKSKSADEDKDRKGGRRADIGLDKTSGAEANTPGGDAAK